MTKYRIQELAIEAKRRQQSLTDKEAEALKLLREESELATLEQFEAAFHDELPLLQEAGIKCSAHWNNERYEAYGKHIKFVLGDKELKMDFESSTQYRYEHAWKGNRKRMTMRLGAWDKDRFYIFIAEGLGLIDQP